MPRDDAAVEAARADLARLDAPFAEHETANYVILYDCDESLAVQRARLLENLYRSYFAFLQKMGIRHRKPRSKLIVVAFEDEDGFARYAELDGMRTPGAGGSYLQGFYNSATNRAAFFNQRRGGAYEAGKRELESLARRLAEIPGSRDTPVMIDSPNGPVRMTKGGLADELVRMKKRMIAQFEQENLVVTQHEGAHQLAFNTGLQRRDVAYPFWVSEGLACMFESPGTNQGFGAFRVNSERLRDYRDALERGATRGLGRLVKLDSEEGSNLTDLYAESWALFFFLARTMPKELSAYLDELSSRKHVVQLDPANEWALFEKHFHPDANPLDTRWQNFLRALR